MSDLKEMYQGMPFSPDGYLTKAINSTDTDIHVNDEGLFPPAPNIATISNDENGEVIIYTAVAKGILSGCTRGIVGSAKDWAINTVIARNYTCEDQKRFINNILYLQEHKVDKIENKDLVDNEEINKLKSITTNAENKITNDITGNAATATKLKTSVNIFGLPFDGSKNLVEDDNHKLVTNAEKIIIRETSNPNLLINGDFQVWQRGTEFNTGWGYCADRWYIQGSAKIKKEDNALVLESSNFNGIRQTVEFNDFYKGKFVTLSLNIKTNNPNNLFHVFVSDGVSNKAVKLGANTNYEIITTTCKLADNATTLIVNIQPTTINNTVLSIKWVKLELGEVATPFIPRLYAEEEMLCKRYFERIGNGYSATLISLHKTLVDDILTGLLYFTAKRISPSIIFSELNQYRCYLTSGGNALNVSNIVATSIMLDRAFIIVTTPNNFTVGTHFLLQRTDPATKAWIDLDAEIY